MKLNPFAQVVLNALIQPEKVVRFQWISMKPSAIGRFWRKHRHSWFWHDSRDLCPHFCFSFEELDIGPNCRTMPNVRLQRRFCQLGKLVLRNSTDSTVNSFLSRGYWRDDGLVHNWFVFWFHFDDRDLREASDLCGSQSAEKSVKKDHFSLLYLVSIFEVWAFS